MSNNLIKIRKRLRDDFTFYAEHCVRIRPKEGDVKPLILNKVQQRLADTIDAQYKATGKVRIIILKARQQGLSTFASAYLYFLASQRRAKKGIVIAHKADSTRTLFDMYKRIHRELPEWVRPVTRTDSAKELSFASLDSGIKVETAGGKGIARGETINYAHLSEMAQWDPETAQSNFDGLIAAIPPGGQDTVVLVESTAFGASGLFYEMWQGAVADINGFTAFFSPWFDSPEYREAVPPAFERTYEEQDLVERYGLDNEQLMFRRKTIGLTSLDAFEQEYPSCPEEAFKTSGRPVFEPADVQAAASRAQPLIRRMAVENGALVEHSRGELAVYREYDKAETYTIGADVAGGHQGGDYSVAQILDSSRRQVAVWRGHVQPDYFATILAALGIRYNTALIAPENNDRGILTSVDLHRVHAYPNIFRHITEGGVEDKESLNFGFRTTHVSKPLIIDRLRAELRLGTIEINDPATLGELGTYIINKSGKFEAQSGCYDDCVMSLAIANHLLVAGAWDPIDFGDDYYYDAI